jgi:hypothetical protein
MTYTQIWDHMTNAPSQNVIVRDEDGAFVPFDPANRDYAEYLAWLDEGNQPTPATAPNQSAQRPAPARQAPRPTHR